MRKSLLALIICVFALPANAQYSGGSGEPNDPYQIATADDLIVLGETPDDYYKHFVLTADIDLDPNLPGGCVFDEAVIAPDGMVFTGVFDGNGHRISHLTIVGVSYLGLFGQLGSGAEVRALGVVAVSITGSAEDVNDVESSQVGALAGLSLGTVVRCYSSGTVNGELSVGGLVGQTGAWGGRGWRGAAGFITESCSTARVDGEAQAGGLVGQNLYGTVTHCFSTGPVTGGDSVGGLVGYNGDTVTACYSTGSVSGTAYVGGLVGYNGGAVAKCYSAGAVGGDAYTGGLAGDGDPFGILLSVWDVASSGLATSAGGVGLATTEMMDVTMLAANGFADDPNWVADAGQDYPSLAWEGKPGVPIPAADIDWFDGQGTAEAPYRIATAEQLIRLGKAGALWDRHFVLDGDIDLGPDQPNVPVFGQAVIPVFSGTFAGAGHTIAHLTIEGASSLGLFGVLDYASNVTQLGVVDANVIGSGGEIGGLAGTNYGTVTECYSTGTVAAGEWNVGGLLGSNVGLVTDCYSNCSVQGATEVGGLIGSQSGTLGYCYSTGAVAGNENVGGLVGTDFAGGQWFSPVATHSFWDVEASGQADSAAGAGKTTAELQTAVTFFEWGVCDRKGLWTIDAGQDYPRLWWEERAGEPIQFDLSEFVAGAGTPEQPYLIGTLDDVNTIALFPCEQEASFRLTFVAGTGSAEDPYVIRTADDLDLLLACPYERDRNFQLGFVAGTGTSADPYIIDDAEDLELLARCPYEQDKQFRLGFVAGEGTQERPYLIESAHQLDLIGSCPYERKARFLLTADIDLSGFDGIDGRPTFHTISSFAGLFDGDGHIISHLTITGRGNVALFGQLASGAEIRDLGIVDVNVVGTGSYVAGLVARSDGYVIGCYCTGTVSGSEYVGGLVAENTGLLAECYGSALTSGASYVGGLAGWNSGKAFECYSSGSVSGNWSVGGLVGSNAGIVTSCYSTAAVVSEAGLSVGGLVGWDSGSLRRCYSAGRVVGRDGYTGGLIGGGGGATGQCFWDLQTSGQLGLSGLTTALMQTAGTFLEMGWDLVGETDNGTRDVWWIDEGREYPRLTWESCSPQDGARDVPPSQTLRWRPGQAGLLDDIYFGVDEAAVASATPDSADIYGGRQSAESSAYDPGLLTWGQTYYWRVDEADEANPGSSAKGRVWRFTVTDALVANDPADGATDVSQVAVLSWTPAGPDLQYDVYLADTADAVAEATTDSEGIYRGRQTSSVTTYTPGELDRGRTYYWRIDVLDAALDSVFGGQVWSFTVTDACVSPEPADGAVDVAQSPVLRWNPARAGSQYDVYFGQTLDSVADATTASADVYCGRWTAESATYSPGDLVWGQTYYWRVDEIDAASGVAFCQGPVWSFTVTDYDQVLKPMRVTACGSSMMAETGPERTIDGSGLNALDQHSVSSSHMWFANAGDAPVWIQYEFDAVYALSRMWVWNSNIQFEMILGFGAKDVVVEYSLDGTDWTALEPVQFAQATCMSSYTANTVVDLQGVAARFVRLNIMSTYGVLGQCSLSEVRFFHVPTEASAP